MPATPAQIAANRANSTRSTGPRTPEGKAASALNSVSHGAHASERSLLDAPDSPAPTYLAQFTAHLAPVGPLESILVRRLAVFAARTDLLDQALDLLPQLNQRRALLDHLQEKYDAAGPSSNVRELPLWHAALRRYDGNAIAYSRDAKPDTDPDPAACSIAYTLSSARFSRLLRHHAHTDRYFHATLHELQRLQASRTPTPSSSQRHELPIPSSHDPLPIPPHSASSPTPAAPPYWPMPFKPLTPSQSHPMRQNEANPSGTRMPLQVDEPKRAADPRLQDPSSSPLPPSNARTSHPHAATASHAQSLPTPSSSPPLPQNTHADPSAAASPPADRRPPAHPISAGIHVRPNQAPSPPPAESPRQSLASPGNSHTQPNLPHSSAVTSADGPSTALSSPSSAPDHSTLLERLMGHAPDRPPSPVRPARGLQITPGSTAGEAAAIRAIAKGVSARPTPPHPPFRSRP